jgi:mannose-6-phosphate isomerase-like protein (cupin superfamily)
MKSFDAIRNALELPRQAHVGRHDGEGILELSHVYTAEDFMTSLSVLALAVLHPGASVGYHLHDTTEELYIILEGNGVANVDGEERRVTRGDVVLTRPGHSHGLLNDTALHLTWVAVVAEAGAR